VQGPPLSATCADKVPARNDQRSKHVTDKSIWREISLPVLSTILSTLPLFLVGTLAVGIREQLGLSEVALGGLVSSFSIVAVVTSIPFGRIVDRMGYTNGLVIATALSGISMIVIGTFASSLPQLMAAMAIGGLGASLANPAANLALARLIPPLHRGLAFGIKQASVPAAISIAGIAVPLLGETIGWRSAFICGGLGGVTVATVTTMRMHENRARKEERGAPLRLHGGPLKLITGAAFFGMAGVQALATFLVQAAVVEGFSVGGAGVVLSIGSILAIGARIFLGWIADRAKPSWVFSAVTLLLIGGTSGLVLLAFGNSFPIFVTGALVGLAGGWSWNGLVNLSVVRHYYNAPATATGFLLIGAFGGSALGPLIFGWVVVAFNYTLAWCTAGGSMLVAAVLILTARGDVNRGQQVVKSPG
jgi:predicted MFS family arabinose efflux permease